MPPCPVRTGPPTAWRAATRTGRRGCQRTAASRPRSSSVLGGPPPGRSRRGGRSTGTGRRLGQSPPFLGLLVGVEDAQGDHLRKLAGVLVVLDVVPGRRGLWMRRW